ncbi:uncharacterized protein KY384_003265 [Bacidia gigantensis]|uniref:uncharacterized protein n=1 Tax=Bacidia gigantensis TaxID=2732470 RepID=UPI001D0374F1|nr:uncharacterized protein KY384_003265 [Bacidia gigantensis]KAG8531634.1 hypothetical protein KY384_003265 [Bacidia gigantensis]
MGRAQRKKGRLPPRFYLEQRAQLAAQGKTRPKAADNTKKGLASILKKWERFCGELGHHPSTFRKDAQVPDLKIFWKWTMDRYNRIGVASSLKNYWRVLRMHALDKADRDFDPHERRDIHNYINLLIDEYGLRVLPKKKPVIGLDDLYLLLYTHWVLDDSTFKDERQRVQVATGLLTAAFFGCRPCSLFDTRVKLDDPDDPSITADDTAVASGRGAGEVVNHIKMDEIKDMKSNRDGDTGMSIDAAHKADRDSNTSWDGDSDSDSDSGSLYDDYDEDCDTDDDYNAGPEETRSFLYRQVQIPPGRKSLTLKWRRRVLDLPVFQEPLRGAGEAGTSPTAPLRASTWIRYLKRLGQKAGFERSFTQYGLRRGLLNVVNNSALSSFDGRRERLDGAVVRAEDPVETAPSSNPTRPTNKALTARIHAAGYKTIGDAEGTTLYTKKKTAEARLCCTKIKLRNGMIAKARKRHFRTADTLAFDAQFSSTTAAPTVAPDPPPTKPIEYNIPERAEVVRLTCSPGDGLSDRKRLRRRVQAIDGKPRAAVGPSPPSNRRSRRVR